MLPSSCCRLCTNICNESRNLYDANGRRNEVYSLAVKYFSETLRNTKCGQHLKVICMECWKHLVEFDNFKITVMLAQKKLDSNLGISSEDPNQKNETFSSTSEVTNLCPLSRKRPEESIMKEDDEANLELSAIPKNVKGQATLELSAIPKNTTSQANILAVQMGNVLVCSTPKNKELNAGLHFRNPKFLPRTAQGNLEEEPALSQHNSQANKILTNLNSSVGSKTLTPEASKENAPGNSDEQLVCKQMGIEEPGRGKSGITSKPQANESVPTSSLTIGKKSQSQEPKNLELSVIPKNVTSQANILDVQMGNVLVCSTPKNKELNAGSDFRNPEFLPRTTQENLGEESALSQHNSQVTKILMNLNSSVGSKTLTPEASKENAPGIRNNSDEQLGIEEQGRENSGITSNPQANESVAKSSLTLGNKSQSQEPKNLELSAIPKNATSDANFLDVQMGNVLVCSTPKNKELNADLHFRNPEFLPRTAPGNLEGEPALSQHNSQVNKILTNLNAPGRRKNSDEQLVCKQMGIEEEGREKSGITSNPQANESVPKSSLKLGKKSQSQEPKTSSLNPPKARAYIKANELFRKRSGRTGKNIQGQEPQTCSLNQANEELVITSSPRIGNKSPNPSIAEESIKANNFLPTRSIRNRYKTQSLETETISSASTKVIDIVPTGSLRIRNKSHSLEAETRSKNKSMESFSMESNDLVPTRSLRIRKKTESLQTETNELVPKSSLRIRNKSQSQESGTSSTSAELLNSFGSSTIVLAESKESEKSEGIIEEGLKPIDIFRQGEWDPNNNNNKEYFTTREEPNTTVKRKRSEYGFDRTEFGIDSSRAEKELPMSFALTKRKTAKQTSGSNNNSDGGSHVTGLVSESLASKRADIEFDIDDIDLNKSEPEGSDEDLPLDLPESQGSDEDEVDMTAKPQRTKKASNLSTKNNKGSHKADLVSYREEINIEKDEISNEGNRSRGPKHPKTVKEFDEFIAHWRSMLECALCHVTCRSFSLLLQHFQEKHPSEQCYISCCQHKFYHRYEIEQHILYHQEKTRFKCKICFKLFTKRCYLRRHLVRIHKRIPAETLTCSKCGRHFNSKSALGKHERFSCAKLLAREQGSHKCVECGNFYTTKKSLRRHFRSKHMAKGLTFKCTICDKVFVYSQSLRDHMGSHADKPSHACQFCPQAFLSRQYLYAHLTSKHPQEYSSQVKKESDGRKRNTNTCTICDKVCPNSRSLRKHETTHHGNASLYKCKHCPKEYRYSSGLTRHNRRHHPEVYERNRLNLQRKSGVEDLMIKKEK